jgi:hypothetical protein
MEFQELLERRIARFTDRVADWDAFADARVEGFRRAQHRFIGAGASGKGDARAIPPSTSPVHRVCAACKANAPTRIPSRKFLHPRGQGRAFIEDGKGAGGDGAR